MLMSAQSSTSTRRGSATSTSSTNSKEVVFKLPNPNIIMKPAELAKLLVAADSMQYQTHLSKSKADSMLRANTQILGSLNKDAEPVNVNDTYLVPFMKKYFDTPGVIKMLDAVLENYCEQSDQIHALYKKTGNARDFARSDEAAALLVPLIKPIINFICGKDMSLESSGFPKPVLELMLAVDEEIIIWFEKNGSGDPADLDTARKNALTSFLGTRSFMGPWTTSLTDDRSKPDRFYQPLVGYLNTYLNLQIKNFTSKLMNATPEQKRIISKQAAIIDSRAASSGSKSSAAVNALAEKLREPEKPEKKGGFLNFFKKEEKAEVTSPRGKKETEVMHSPRRQLKRGDTLQESANREVTLEKNRSKFIAQFSRTYKLEQNLDFLRHFKESVLNMERAQYKDFKADPLKYCITCLEAYTMRFLVRDGSTQTQISALISLSLELASAVGKDSSQDKQ